MAKLNGLGNAFLQYIEMDKGCVIDKRIDERDLIEIANNTLLDYIYVSLIFVHI